MKRLPTIATSALGLGAFLFWLVAHPEWISYQEQYQLFLFNADYMAERLSVAGGVADYAAEFITQFFYVVPLGALLMALICVALQRLCLLVCRRALPCRWCPRCCSWRTWATRRCCPRLPWPSS